MSVLTVESAHKAVGQKFHLLGVNDDQFALLLTAVTPAKPTPHFAGKTRDPFAMFFTGSSTHFYPQAVYTLSNPALGELEIFLVPIGRDAATANYLYQAVFN